MANIYRRDKAPGNKIVLEDIRDLFGIPLVGFPTANRFHKISICEGAGSDWTFIERLK